jgi:predicted DNA-binding protein
MSDLLNRNKTKNKLARPAEVKPNQTFDISSVEELKERPLKQKKKTTTVRVSEEMKDKLNALVTLGIADSVDTVVDVLYDEYVNSILDKEEKKQLKMMQDIYKKKAKK